MLQLTAISIYKPKNIDQRIKNRLEKKNLLVLIDSK